MTGVRETSFFEITSQSNKYTVANVTDTYLPYLNDDFIPGDVNRDGLVNVSDVTVLISYVLNDGGVDIDLDAADLSGDGNINITDATQLISIVLNSMEK